MKFKDIKIGERVYVNSPKHEEHENGGKVVRFKSGKVVVRFGHFNCRECEFNPGQLRRT